MDFKIFVELFYFLVKVIIVFYFLVLKNMSDKKLNLEKDIFKYFKKKGIKFVCIFFCDNVNIICFKVFYID